MVMTHTHCINKVRCQLFQKLNWKQVNGQTDMTDYSTLPTNAISNNSIRLTTSPTMHRTMVEYERVLTHQSLQTLATAAV